MSMRAIVLFSGASGKISQVINDLISGLHNHGVGVTLLDPDEFPAEAPLPGADAVVLKDKSPAGLALGRRFHMAGVPTISPYPATELCRDKLAANRVLERAGLPVPLSYGVRSRADVVALLDRGPMVLKPVRGSRGRGITVVERPDDIPDLGGEDLFAQRYFRPDSRDLKIYRIGEEYFCVERIWPPLTLEDKQGRLAKLDSEVLGLARACGDALGTTIYGVDVIRHGGRPWIVDASSFPGFKGVPEAGARLAREVLAAMGGRESRPQDKGGSPNLVG